MGFVPDEHLYKKNETHIRKVLIFMQTTLLMTSLEEKQKEQLNKIGKEALRKDYV